MADLWSQYQTKLQPVTAQSEQLLKDYLALASQQGTFQQKLLDAIKQAGQYPSQATMREEYAQNPNLTPMALEALVSRRGASTRGTIADVINRAYGGFQSDIAQKQMMAQLAQQQRQNLLEEYGLAKAAQPGPATQWQTQQALRKQLLGQAGKGATLSSLTKEFGGGLDLDDIVELYTGAGFYGEPEEPWARKLLGIEEKGLDEDAINAYVQMINDGSATLSNVPKEYKNAVSIRLGKGEEKIPGFSERLKQILGW